MTKPAFTITCVASDRTRPLATGEVNVPGAQLDFRFGEPEAIFREALNNASSEITELSMSSHIITTARGDARYVAVPIFLSRAFRHSAIFVRAEAGFSSLADLKGANIGVPEYQQTAAMWVRGMMSQAGVAASDVTWHVGGLNAPSQGERIKISLPDDIKVNTLSGADTLNEMLLSGRLDAIISPRVPDGLVRGDRRVARLYPDLKAAETAYYKETGFFPIMHALAVRKDVAEEHPWLPEALFTAFTAAKRQRQEEMAMTNVLRVSHPWSVHDFTEAMQLTGGNPWPYGFARNRDELEAMTRFMQADGTASRKVDPEELFHPSTLALVE
ncbi:ABC transporter substrate-binding protein [Alkalilacustris brevis]|uniref:ABC transporter substrate-binding protein n=1 Tax=Alkalilacustris brevis TaxID=2026338 RepID=UPI000E0DA448|nr:ABC transporter substrate-binding protein [Alkalilacustris brevis]